MRKYDYFNGCEWTTLDEQQLQGVTLKGLKEVHNYAGRLKCIYNDGQEVYYENVFGTWGRPVVFK